MLVCFGELMLRLGPPGRQRLAHCLPGTLEATFAGAEVNVAVAVAQLGAPARFVSALPAAHSAAEAALRELSALGVDGSGILRTDTGRLGVYYYEPGSTARSGTVTYDRADSAFALSGPEAYDWDRLLAGASRLHLSGITPAVSAPACAAALAALAAAARLGLPVSLDINFRSALWRWSPDLAPASLAARELRALASRADILFAGPTDAALLLDGPPPTDTETAFRSLARAYPKLRLLASSHRDEDALGRPRWSGRLLDLASGTYHHGPEFLIHETVDRLGVGDAFAGGLLRALSEPGRAAPASALALAVASGALKHGLPGDYLRASLTEAEAALAGADPGRVRR